MQTMMLLDRLQQNTLDLYRQQQRLVTGNKFVALSDDPAAASRAIKLSGLLEQQAHILDNIRYADGFLSATDQTVGNLGDLLIEARDIASESLNMASDQAGPAQQAEWNSFAGLIGGILDQMVTVGNMQFQGIYLFGGQRTTTAPFVQDLGGVAYRGDTGELRSRVDLLAEASFNLTGAEVFGALSSEVMGWRDLSPALTGDTRLADMNGAGGEGISLGSIEISDSSMPGAVTVDLSGADNIQDVIDLINDALSAGTTTVAVGSNGIDVTIAGGETVTFSEIGGGQTAVDMGIAGTYAASFSGDDLDARLTLMTPLAALNDGAGVSLTSGVLISNGENLSATVDLSAAATIQDVLNAFNEAGVAVLARINEAGTGIDVVNRLSGGLMRIGENGGTDAEQLGIRSLYGGTLLSDLNSGLGVATMEGESDFRVHLTDGQSFDVDVSSAVTVQEVIDAINAAAGAVPGLSVGPVPGNDFFADLTDSGNGIRLTDDLGGGGQFSIEKLNLSPAVDGLGLLDKTGSGGGPVVLVSDDANPVECEGIFGALCQLWRGLSGGDRQVVTAAGERIGELIVEVNRWQGVVGAQSRAMSERLLRTEDAVDATRIMLSGVKDVDFTEAVTRFQQAQTALEANLMTSSRMMNLSLLNFLR